MKNNIKILGVLFSIVAIALVSSLGCGTSTPSKIGGESATPPATLRLGYFANLTHAPALLGVSRGEFQQALGTTKLESKTFNAGPSIIEAFFAGELDIAYIGPSPAVNGFIKSNGEQIRVISGASANGVVIIASKDSAINSLADLAGKRIATPQFGNTQDISARHYLIHQLKTKLKDSGGETDVQPAANADQLNLFRQGQLDAAWSPEPWASRLIHESGARLIAEEKDLWQGGQFCSALVIVSVEFLKQHPKTVEDFLRAHTRVTKWINTNQNAAAEQLNAELKRLSGKALAPEVLTAAFGRVKFSTDPLPESVKIFAQWAKDLNLLKKLPNLDALFELSIQQKIDAEILKP